jgi:hypothetical protein
LRISTPNPKKKRNQKNNPAKRLIRVFAVAISIIPDNCEGLLRR